MVYYILTENDEYKPIPKEVFDFYNSAEGSEHFPDVRVLAFDAQLASCGILAQRFPQVQA